MNAAYLLAKKQKIKYNNNKRNNPQRKSKIKINSRHSKQVQFVKRNKVYKENDITLAYEFNAGMPTGRTN